MTFYGEAELAGLEAQSWAALGDHHRAVEHARRAIGLQAPHFTRNTALYTAELANNLACAQRVDEAAVTGARVLDLLGRVQSPRVRGMLSSAAQTLQPYARRPDVAGFLQPAGGVAHGVNTRCRWLRRPGSEQEIVAVRLPGGNGLDDEPVRRASPATAGLPPRVSNGRHPGDVERRQRSAPSWEVPR